MFSLCHNRDPWKQIESGKVWEMLPYCPCPVVVDRANSPVVGTHKACGVQDPMGSPSHHPLSPFYNKPTFFYWKSSQFASQNLWLTLELCCHSFWELSKEFGKLGGGKSCDWTQKPWEIEKGVGQDLNLEPIPHSSWCDSPGWEELLLCKLAQLFTICYPQCHQCSISMCQLLYWQW